MNKSNVFRFCCLVILWLALCYLILTRKKIDFMVIFTIIASGIIIFVPVYKRYFKRDNGKEKKK